VTATMEDNAELSGKESDEDPPRPFRISSYSGLLQFPEIPAIGKDTPSALRGLSAPVVDAIVVPTVRSAEQASCAVELASRARCQLLMLYTDSFPAGLPTVLAGLRQGVATPVALRPVRGRQLIDLGLHKEVSEFSRSVPSIPRIVIREFRVPPDSGEKHRQIREAVQVFAGFGFREVHIDEIRA